MDNLQKGVLPEKVCPFTASFSEAGIIALPCLRLSCVFFDEIHFECLFKIAVRSLKDIKSSLSPKN